MTLSATSVFARAFSGLTEATMAELKKVSVPKRYAPNVVLCKQGEIAETFYVILAGAVAIEQHLPNGESRFLGVLKARDYFGEMGLLDGQPRLADCVTVQECTVLEISRENFDKFVQHSPAVGHAIMRKMLNNLRELDRSSIEDLLAKNQALQEAYDKLEAAQEELARKKAQDHELAIAAQVQRSLLPGELPSYPGYRFAGVVTPARLVGGDFYDVIDIDDDHTGLLIADVADKGFHAALFMAVSRTLFLQEGKRSLSPAAVTLAVHQGMLDVSTTDDTFVTAFYGVLQRSTGRLTYVIAGQERPLLYRPGRGVTTLPGKGRFLGMLDELELREYVTVLEPGDRLILFSDGVSDAMSFAGEQFGTGRLGIFLNNYGYLSATGLLEKIEKRLELWSKNADQFDDITLVVVEMLDVN